MNEKIDNRKVNTFYDLIDKACMVYYDDIGLDYLEAFIRFTDSLVNEFDESKITSKAIKKLQEIIATMEEKDFLNEEIRLAIELIIIKGLKHRNILLDFVTPDIINYIYSYMCNAIIKYNYLKYDNVTIMDTVLGTSNMLQTIINNSQVEVAGIGIEHDELLIHVSQAFAQMLDNNLICNFGDAKQDMPGLADIIIGDFGENSDVHEIILKRLDNLSDNGYFLYMINNDFFSKANENFKKELTSNSTLVGLIVLPHTLVAKGHIGKSILIGKKELLKDYHMAVIQIDENLDEENMQKTLTKINKMFDIIGGNQNA